jgi:ABC-type phosphate transport system substrate-binding protein
MYAVDFLAEGSYLGDPGYNATHNNRRLVNFDATGDANGRLTTLANPNATAVLRAGTFPVVRPNGSGAGINFILNADTTAPFKVNYVRSSRMPSPGEQTTATNLGYGGLHCYQIGLDGLSLAVSNLTTSNAGTGGVTVNDLVQIYSATGTIRTWGQVPNYNGPNPGATIVPVIPQTGSGTASFFIAQLTAAAGGSFTLRTDPGILVSEEHDPTPIQSNANAIGPFSTARLAMINNGFFNLGTPPTTAPVKLLAAPSFAVTRPILVLVRQNSVTNPSFDGLPAVWNDGKSWVNALFAPGGFASNALFAGPLIADAAGFTYQYQDLGLCHS